LFGLLDALQMRMQGLQIAGVGVPVQFIQILPYLATVIVLAGFIGRARAPRSLGLPFEKV
jgi:simple sugar transport system permease protein